MANNFDLRQFLTENKLTKNTQTLSEGSDYGFDEVMDAIGDDFTPGTPEFEQMEDAVQDAFHNGQVDTSEFSHDPSAPGREMRAIANQIGLGDEKANDIEQAQHDIERQYEETVNENKMTDKEKTRIENIKFNPNHKENNNVKMCVTKNHKLYVYAPRISLYQFETLKMFHLVYDRKNHCV